MTTNIIIAYSTLIIAVIIGSIMVYFDERSKKAASSN